VKGSNGMRTWGTMALLALAAVAAEAQTTRLDTLRHWNVRPGARYSAVWGYTAPDGREYALIGVNGSGSRPAGTSIIDITDAPVLREAAFITGPASTWREMKTYRHYAYVVSEGGGGTQIIDLSRLPDTARLVRSFTYTSGAQSTSRSHTVSLHDGFLYLNGCANWSPGGMLIFDLRTDPTNPVYAGQYQPDYIHDSYVLRDTIYAAAVNSGGGLYIADARNKASIRQIAKISYSGSGTHNVWVTRDRRYAVTTDEIGTTPKDLKFWNIAALPSVPSSPAAAFTPVPGQTVHNVTIRGDYAYVAWYSAGVRVVRVADPASPADAGGYDTSPAVSGYEGVWGVYPYYPSGKIVAGDMENGLWVFRFTDLSPRTAVRLRQPVQGDTLRGTGTAAFRWTRTADPVKDPHWYQLRVWGGGLDTTLRAADSSAVLPLARFAPGTEYRWTVRAQDEWNDTASPDTFRVFRAQPTAAGEPEAPQAFALEQNFPNPFNPGTTIAFEVPVRGGVVLRVYNLLGQQVAELVNEVLPAGRHRVSFDAGLLPSGVYFYRLNAGGAAAVRRMVLAR